ncbi:hypothetical protein AAHC03_09451 [Spirometra sp. Aus1]
MTTNLRKKFPFQPKTKTPLSPIQVQEISEAFALFDADKDNHLTPFEFKTSLNALGLEVKQQELTKLLDEHNLTPDSKVSYSNFLSIASTLTSLRDPVTEIVRAFTLFDDEGNGKISYRNLKKISKEIGENLTDEELHTMIDEFDRDGDRAINLEEFMAIMSDST